MIDLKSKELRNLFKDFATMIDAVGIADIDPTKSSEAQQLSSMIDKTGSQLKSLKTKFVNHREVLSVELSEVATFESSEDIKSANENMADITPTSSSELT